MEGISYSVTRSCLYEQVADSLERSIIAAGGAEPGAAEEKLPSENELTKSFGVSRTVVREALKLLKERGLIELRTGDGAYVTRPSGEAISSVVNRIVLLDNISLDAVHEMRVVLETASARFASLRATDEELATLDAMLERMREHKDDIPVRIRLDIGFHVAIAGMSGNPLLWKFVETMTTQLRDFIGKGVAKPGSGEDMLLRHAAIVASLRSRDPEIAAATMREHLEVSRQNIRAVLEAGQASPDGGAPGKGNDRA